LKDDEARIASYYDALVQQYGHDPRAVDASSREALEVRYAVLAAVTDLTGASVLEVGCGLGDFGAYLTERFDGLEYRGIDISTRMIEDGRRIHPQLDLRQCNLLDVADDERYDVVLAQGIFYLLTPPAEPKMDELVARMFTLARRAVAFTTTSAWSNRRDPDEFYADPVQLLGAARELTRSVVLRHDYHPGDVALYLYKPQAGTA
jgi:SAM-dependent methyltransferase